MRPATTLLGLALAGVSAVACSGLTPLGVTSTAPASSTSGSMAAAISPTPAAMVTRRPSITPLPTPPYTIRSGKPEQEPGSIIFGDLETPGMIAPFAGYPLSFSIDRDWAFGAYFGRAIGASSVTVELFRQRGDQWESTWSMDMDVDPAATGLLAKLRKFEKPGTYRLDVRAGDQVVATSLMSMVPPCVGVCTGG